jgi:uncharacterized membrane protein YgdD (TMEM256/DUF423 family)
MSEGVDQDAQRTHFMNWTLLAGAFFGLTGVAAAAYANHGIEAALVSKVMSGVRLQQVHGLVLVAAGFATYGNLPAKMVGRLKMMAAVFVLGIVLFSGNIYLSNFLGFKGLTFLIPVGGMVIMVGWLMLIWAGLAGKRS